MKDLTQDTLPGTRRDWKEVVERLTQEGNDWCLIEDAVTANRAGSIRRAFRISHPQVQISRRINPDTGKFAVHARIRP